MNRHNAQRLTRLSTQASLALAVAAALVLPLRAEAGSFQLPTDNAAGWARANAGGSLFANDPTAVYNNPAAMAFFTAPVLQITGTGIRPSAQFEGETKDSQGNPTTGGNPNGFGKFVPFPNMAFAAPVNDRLTLGGSVTVPYGLISEYSPTWRGRYFGTKTSVKSIAVSVSAGFKVNDQFAIGVGVVGQRTKAQLNTVLDTTGTAAALTGGASIALYGPPQTADAQLNVNVKKNAVGYFVGFEYKPTTADSIGLSYHSRIGQTLSGNYKLYGGPLAKALIQGGPLQFPTAGLPVLNPAGGEASATLDTPAFASLDWLHAFNDRLSVAGSIKWTQWSSFKTLTLTSNGQTLVSLPQDYKNSMEYTIGGDYKLNAQWTLRAGVGYDETPTNIISRDPRIPDGSRRLVGLGVGYQATDHMGVDLGYQHQFVSDTPVNLTNQVGLGASTMVGKFKDHGDVISLTGTYQF
ncbi:outer membrane protein transport protein [Rhodanobacter ginsengisoli]|uniref:Outer membrane protein transport protein n=1 Tax=Rhodanobacter ginsengisoli TaxID=418646 RepID=A0ABW0QPJ4_9GAMM